VTDNIAITIVSDGPGGKADFATFALPSTFSHLSGVTFTPDAVTNTFNESNFMIDNIAVTAGSVAAPEPGAMWLLGTALAGLGCLRRRR
jgi:hypothetical protein